MKEKVNFKKTLMRRFFCMFFILITIICFANPLCIYAEDTEQLKVVKIACGINNSLYLNENGEPEGYCKTYLETLANINHWKIEYVNGSWDESIERFTEGKVDIIFPVQKSEERAKKMEFSDLCGGYQPIGLYTSKEMNCQYDDFNVYNHSKIAVSKESSNETTLNEFAKQNDFTFEPVYIDSIEGKIDAVNEGRADFIATSSLFTLDNFVLTSIMSYQPFYYAVEKGNTELLGELNNGMKQIMAQQPELAADVYLKFLYSETKVATTIEENEWIVKNKKIVVGVYKDTPPLYHNDKNGNAYGVYVDLADLLEKYSEIKIELYPISREQYAYDLLDNGTIDVLLGSNDVSIKALHSNKYLYSSPIMNYATTAVSKKNYILKKDNKPVFILTSARKYWEPMILKENPTAVIHYCKTPKDCLIAIQKGKADITLLNAWEFNYHSKNSRFNDLIEWESDRTYADIVMVALTDKDPIMMSLLNKAISAITEDEINEIVTRNLNRQYDIYSITDLFYENRVPFFICLSLIVLIMGIFITYVRLKKKYVRKLEENNHQLEQANAEKTLFMSRMSHELRTPLNAIAGYSILLQKKFANDVNYKTEYEEICAIYKAEQSLLAIIDGILNVQQIETGNIELSHEKYNAAEYLENVMWLIQLEAKEKKIEFNYERRTHLSSHYLGDGAKIEQILLNILHNAIKFTPEGGKVLFTAEAEKKDDKYTILKFIISDTGIGMSKDFVDKKLFHVFNQEDNSINSPYEGTGVGLAFSRELARKMGGDITCVSEKGKGSTFTITVEVETVTNYIDNNVQKEKEYDFHKLKVLICEDNIVNQKILEKILINRNCIVDVAENGKEGLQKISNSEMYEYKLILMDIRMPVMDGYEAVKKIRELDREDAKSTPIFAVSANAFDEDIKQSIAVGMNEHLTKPVNVQQLYKKIYEYCHIND